MFNLDIWPGIVGNALESVPKVRRRGLHQPGNREKAHEGNENQAFVKGRILTRSGSCTHFNVSLLSSYFGAGTPKSTEYNTFAPHFP